MKTTIFVPIIIAALGAVGVSTSIASSVVTVHAQPAGCNAGTCTTNGQQPGCNAGPDCITSGHTTTSGCTPGSEFCSISGSGHVADSGGGQVSVVNKQTFPPYVVNKCVGSVDFQTATGCGPPPTTH